jgi:F0F1-type ATP synthase assembly protein I
MIKDEGVVLSLLCQHCFCDVSVLTLLEDLMIINLKSSRTNRNNAAGKPLMTRKRPWKMETRKIMALASLGLMLPSSIAVGLFIGYLLDKILGTHPWLLLIFLFLGTASGLYSLLRGLNRFQDENEAEDTEIR